MSEQPVAAAGAVEGPSFPVGMKLMAMLFVLTLVSRGMAAWAKLELARFDPAVGLLALAAVGLVAAGLWGIFLSRTRFDGHQISQHGLWTKRVALSEITQVKLIHVRALAWLMVPRLVVRTRTAGVYTFPTADPQVLAAFQLLAYGEPQGGASPAG